MYVRISFVSKVTLVVLFNAIPQFLGPEHGPEDVDNPVCMCVSVVVCACVCVIVCVSVCVCACVFL